MHRRWARALCVAVAGLYACGEPELGSNTYPITAAVEQWRELVEKYFKYQHVTWALNIVQCESGGDPDAYNASSGASGLFQHLAKYWPPRATAAGFPGASPFNAEANIAASAYLLYAAGGGPQHWACKYSPFEDFGYTPQFYKDGVAVKPPEPPPPPPPPPPPTPDKSAPTIKKDSSPAPKLDGGAASPEAGPAPSWPSGGDAGAPLAQPAAPEPGTLTGGCSVGGSQEGSAWWPLLLALGLALASRRRTGR